MIHRKIKITLAIIALSLTSGCLSVFDRNANYSPTNGFRNSLNFDRSTKSSTERRTNPANQQNLSMILITPTPLKVTDRDYFFDQNYNLLGMDPIENESNKPEFLIIPPEKIEKDTTKYVDFIGMFVSKYKSKNTTSFKMKVGRNTIRHFEVRKKIAF